MLPAEITNLPSRSIIDLVVLPCMDITSIVLEVTQRFTAVFILDTQGELHSKFSTCGWDVENTRRINYVFVSTMSELYRRITSLFPLRGMVLVIDSVTFVCDISPLEIKPFSSILWSLVYECGATVVTINHYRVDQQRKILRLAPRMGVYWRNIVSYQVEFIDAGDHTKYRLLENRIIDL